uniref:HlyE_0 protein n=1 Tax=Fopius arisanus TaxID=64838 RepID=A0A0C9Q827_9HYME
MVGTSKQPRRSSKMRKTKGKIYLFLVFGLILHQHLVSGIIPGLMIVYDVFDKLNNIHDVHAKFSTPSSADLMNATEQLSAKIDKLVPEITAHIDKAVDTLLTRLPLLGELSGDIRTLNNHVGKIDRFYYEMKLYLQKPDWYSEKDLRELLKIFTSRDSGQILDVIGEMRSLIVPDKLSALKKNVFQLLAEETQGWGLSVCDTYAPPQQRLLDLYETVVDSEIRAFLMACFGYKMEDYLNNDNSTGRLERTKFGFETRIAEYEKVVRNAMKIVPREFRRCDPDTGYEKNVNYYRLDQFRYDAPLYAVTLRSFESDINNNMVVTGLAFVVKNNVLTFRMETAKLNISGNLDDSTAFWQEPEDIAWNSEKSTFILNDELGPIEMRNDIDIAYIAGSNKRIYLDNPVAPAGSVVTGVRFGRLYRDHLKPLQLQIRVTPIDYDRGIVSGDSKWISEQPLRRTAFKEDSKLPANEMRTSIDGGPDGFVDFDWSTGPLIPFFDGLPVTSEPRTPLGGIGLYRKKS